MGSLSNKIKWQLDSYEKYHLREFVKEKIIIVWCLGLEIFVLFFVFSPSVEIIVSLEFVLNFYFSIKS